MDVVLNSSASRKRPPPRVNRMVAMIVGGMVANATVAGLTGSPARS